MKKLLFIMMWALVLANYARAQEQLTIQQQADKLYERYEYFKSLGLYLKLAGRHKNDVKLAERIADCYREINQYDNAEQWYAKVTADAKASKISHYYYAEVLLRELKLDAAKQQYKIYFSNDAEELKSKLNACDSAAAWMKQVSPYNVSNAGRFNTEYSDWGLTYEGKANMVFTSDRTSGGESPDNRTGNNWFKLYEADLNGNEIKDFPLVNGTNNVFTGEYHIGPVAFNHAADTAYITLTTEIAKKELPIDKQNKTNTQRLYTRRLQLVMAGKKNGQWVIFKSFPYNNIQKYSVGEAALSKDGRLIYFTSDMPGGQGKTDIWYCEKQADGNWGGPINCGKTINTKEEEAFPNVGGDGALYYSSKGLPGMGGYDIYKAKGAKSEWGKPENLKYPINTTSDDLYLETSDGVNGYLSSNRQDGKGSDDIYSFSYKPIEVIPFKPVARTDTAGAHRGKQTKGPQSIVLNTIYYDLDKSNIRPDAAIELDKLVAVLKQHPAIKIELSSYTDSRASENYNMALSRRRARAAVEYLNQKGISSSRLVAKYYGKNNLVNGCVDDVPCSEAAHQLNRRTEFRVIGE